MLRRAEHVTTRGEASSQKCIGKLHRDREGSQRESITGFESSMDALHSSSVSPPPSEAAAPVRGRFFSAGGMMQFVSAEQPTMMTES